MSVRRSVEMSISREEFFRLLPAAVGPFVADGDRVRPAGAGRGWTIMLTPLAEYRVGRVAVPRHRVEIEIDSGSEEDAAAFMDRFHRAFLRGGG